MPGTQCPSLYLYGVFMPKVPLVPRNAVIYADVKTAAAVSHTLNEHLETVALWLDRSCLALNVNEIVSICFSSGRRPTPIALNININNQSISHVTEVKYLGLMLHAHLNFEKHIKKIINLVRLNLFTFRLIRDCLTFEAANIYLHSMIFSHLGCCVTAWSQASHSAIKPLERLYIHALKTLGKRPIRSHHCNILRDLNVLSFDNYIASSNINLIYKRLHGQAPQVLCDLVQPMQGVGRSTRRAAAWNCRVPHRKTSLGQSSFLIKGANI